MLRQELFRRMDESPDALFYEVPRLVTHIDDAAIAAVTQLYREHFPAGGAILDLMSSWVSHLPEEIAYRRVVGLGMNAAELAANARLHARVVQDLNQDPRLPFADGEFDAGGICVSVDYLIHPVEVLRECGRVILPGGPLVITFSNRCFPTKAIAAWQMLDDEGHQRLVEQFFEAAGNWTRSPGSTGARRSAMTRCTPWWPEAPARTSAVFPIVRTRKDHAHDLAGRARSPDEERHAPRGARPPRAGRLSEAPHLPGHEPAAAAPRAAPAGPRARAADPDRPLRRGGRAVRARRPHPSRDGLHERPFRSRAASTPGWRRAGPPCRASTRRARSSASACCTTCTRPRSRASSSTGAWPRARTWSSWTRARRRSTRAAACPARGACRGASWCCASASW